MFDKTTFTRPSTGWVICLCYKFHARVWYSLLQCCFVYIAGWQPNFPATIGHGWTVATAPICHLLCAHPHYEGKRHCVHIHINSSYVSTCSLVKEYICHWHFLNSFNKKSIINKCTFTTLPFHSEWDFADLQKWNLSTELFRGKVVVHYSNI